MGTSSPSIANYNGLPAGTRALFLCVQLEEEVQQEKEALDLMVNLKEAWANRQTCFFGEREGGNIQPSRETLNFFGITYVVKEEKSGLYFN